MSSGRATWTLASEDHESRLSRVFGGVVITHHFAASPKHHAEVTPDQQLKRGGILRSDKPTNKYLVVEIALP